MAFKWSHENIETLINGYRVRGELWDPKDNKYHIKNRKNDAWCELASEVGCDVAEAKMKMSSLLSSFRREKAKEKNSRNFLGSGRDQRYVSNWFAYKMLSFLKEKDTPTNTLDTESVSIEHFPEANDEECNEPEPVGLTGYQSNPGSVKSIPPSKKRRLRMDFDDTRLAQASRITDNAEKNTRDECTTFGAYIAAKLQKFSDRNRNFLMHKMTTLIFETEMNIDDNNEQSNSESNLASDNLYLYSI